MPQIKRSVTPKLTKVNATTLQNFSQCAFDILQIVKTVIKYPGEYKELNQKYFTLVKLLEKLRIPAGDLRFKDEGYFLPLDIIYLPYREENDKKVLYKAETNLRDLVFRIEQKRAELLGEEYVANTGLRDPDLKQMLESIENNNTIRPLIKENGKPVQVLVDNTRPRANNGNELRLKDDGREGALVLGTKEVKIGSIDNVPYKLCNCLLPLGTQKESDVLFRMTNPKEGKYAENRRATLTLTRTQEENVIKNRLKELQEITSKEGLKLFLVFGKQDHRVSMDMK
jgi:hypothetical protein